MVRVKGGGETLSSLYLIRTSGLGDFIFFLALRRNHLSWFTLDFFDIFCFFFPCGCGVRGSSPTEKRAKPPSVSSVTAVLPCLAGDCLRAAVANPAAARERSSSAPRRGELMVIVPSRGGEATNRRERRPAAAVCRVLRRRRSSRGRMDAIATAPEEWGGAQLRPPETFKGFWQAD
jgi:hypothetical protein